MRSRTKIGHDLNNDNDDNANDGDDNDDDNSKSINILCFDGGGAKGVLYIYETKTTKRQYHPSLSYYILTHSTTLIIFIPKNKLLSI